MEQFIKDTIEEFGQDIRNSLSVAIGKIFSKAYNKRWVDCKKAYHIDDAKFLKEQEDAARVYYEKEEI